MSAKDSIIDDISSSDSDDDDIDIHEFARTGTLQEFKEALARDKPRLIALKDRFGRIAIHYAVAFDQMEIVMHLIVKKTDINPKDNNDQTPLHLAASRGLTDMCRTLLEFQANIKLKDKDCWTPLHHAVDGRFYETATLLIKRGADLSAEDHKYGRTPLHIACEKGYHDIAEMLIIRGSNLYASGDYYYGKTPLHLACYYGHIETVRMLVKRGADVNVLSGFLDKNPLHLACERGFIECVDILIETGMDVNLMGNHVNGYTALHLAIINSHMDIVRLLVTKGKADMELWGRFRACGAALHIAAAHGEFEIAALLLKLGADINNRNEHALTPLHIACQFNHYDIALWLIESGSDPRLKGHNGKIPLDYITTAPTVKEQLSKACEKALKIREIKENAERERIKQEIEQKLREEEERIRKEKEAEEFRLYMEKRTKEFKALLLHVTDSSGELSAFLSIVEEYPEMNINMILIDDMKSTGLMLASKHGFHSVVHAILHWPGVQVNLQDNLGNTALHYGAMINQREIIEELILAGTHNGLMNKQGKAAANYTTVNYLTEIIRNPILIADKTRYQDNVMKQIFNSKNILKNPMATIKDIQELVVVPQLEQITLTNANATNLLYNKNKMIEGMDGGGANNNKLLAITNTPTSSTSLVLSPTKSTNKMPTTTSLPNMSSNSLSTTTAVVSTVLDTTMTQKQFGSIPARYGGCRWDMLDLSHYLPAVNDNINSSQNNNSSSNSNNNNTSNNSANTNTDKKLFLDLIILQQSYLPNAFESMIEWYDVRDFLWLLGYPYKPTEDHKNTTYNIRGNIQYDKRSYFNYIATTMNTIQKLFVNQFDIHGYLTQGDGSTTTHANATTAGTADANNSDNSNNDDINKVEAADTHQTSNTNETKKKVKFPSIADKYTIKGIVEKPKEKKVNLPLIHIKNALYQLDETVEHNLTTSVIDKPPIIDNNLEKHIKEDNIYYTSILENIIIPANINKIDFIRLILLSQQCDHYLMYICYLFEPEYYGWPLNNPDGSEFTVYNKLQSIYSSELITKDMYDLLMKLHSYGYNESIRHINNNTSTTNTNNTTSSNTNTTVDTVNNNDSNDNAASTTRKDLSRKKTFLDETSSSTQNLLALIQSSASMSEMYFNPPRYMRNVIDTIYEISLQLKLKAELGYKLDAIRASVWYNEGNRLREQLYQQANKAVSIQTPLQLWLQDLKLLEYEDYFLQKGFKLISDFEGLSEDDCRQYFPFLKIGDLRRISKHCNYVDDKLVSQYEKRCVN